MVGELVVAKGEVFVMGCRVVDRQLQRIHAGATVGVGVGMRVGAGISEGVPVPRERFTGGGTLLMLLCNVLSISVLCFCTIDCAWIRFLWCKDIKIEVWGT